jgi:cytochrome P450
MIAGQSVDQLASQAKAQKAAQNQMQATAAFKAEGFSALTNLQREYGDFVQLPVLPGMSNYLIFSPELAHEVLVERADQFKKPELAKKVMRSSFGNGIFFSEGSFWRRQRKLVQPAFHHARVATYAEAMIRHTQNLADAWRSSASVDIAQAMHTLTFTIVVDALFKMDVSSKAETLTDAMRMLGIAINRQVSSPLQSMLPDWMPTTLNRTKRKSVETIDAIIYQLIEERRRDTRDHGDLLSMFLQARDEETGDVMSTAQIRDELMTMFIAGHETSAAALGWAFAHIAQMPEVADKLRREIDTVCGGKPVSPEHATALPYTKAIVKETLRLYPPAIFIVRQASAAMDIGTTRIRPSDLVSVVPPVIHRNAHLYENPEQFNPDRFMTDLEKQLPKCAYLPFGSGPRVCIGNGFAMMEMQLILATLMQQFTVTLQTPAQQIKPEFNFTLGFASPVILNVRGSLV